MIAQNRVAEQLGISGTVRRIEGFEGDFPSKAEQLGISGTVRRDGVCTIEGKKIPPNSLGFQEQSGGGTVPEGKQDVRAEQLGISGTVRRKVGLVLSFAPFSRTAWDFRNSQAAQKKLPLLN